MTNMYEVQILWPQPKPGDPVVTSALCAADYFDTDPTNGVMFFRNDMMMMWVPAARVICVTRVANDLTDDEVTAWQQDHNHLRAQAFEGLRSEIRRLQAEARINATSKDGDEQ